MWIIFIYLPFSWLLRKLGVKPEREREKIPNHFSLGLFCPLLHFFFPLFFPFSPSPFSLLLLPLPLLPFSLSLSSPPFSFFFKSSFQRSYHPYFSEGRKVIGTYVEATATQRLSCCCFSLVDNEIFWGLGKDMFLTHPLNYLR